MMKTIFDPATRDEIAMRINSLNQDATAQWGKMNAYQMLAHCSKWDDMIQGKFTVKPTLVGRLFGKLVLKSVLKNDKPLRRNTPTIPEMIIRDSNGDFGSAQTFCIEKIKAYQHFENDNFIHPFFLSMTREQIGQLVYKHYDHHLRQFGA